jgi:heparan-alpha-glucosaminide N-acetyltransferase
MSTDPETQSVAVAPSERLASLDAFRGFTMLLMASESLGIPEVAEKFPDSQLWKILAYQFDHAEWRGGGLWDMIQPSFSFMVGVSMAFSYAKRREHGQSYVGMLGHAAWRSVVLIMLGVLLRSRWTFEDTLSQIGLGYLFLFLLWDRPRWLQVIALLGILIGDWYLFAAHPLPPPDFDLATVGVSSEFAAQHDFQGLAAHWNKNRNPAVDADVVLLNLLPRPTPFAYNEGGYHTLNFIPTLATMLIGLITGEWLRSDRARRGKTIGLVVGGSALVVVGLVLDLTGVCPLVKRIWTPSWAVYSSGWALLFLAIYYGVMDWGGWKWWAWPATVVGMNSIAMYVMAHLLPGWIERTITGLAGGDWIFKIADDTYEPMVEHSMVLVVLWFFCWLLYHNRVFIRV